jgi:hypothetical protein
MIGYIPFHSETDASDMQILKYYRETLVSEIDESFTEKIVKQVRSDTIAEYLRYLIFDIMYNSQASTKNTFSLQFVGSAKTETEKCPSMVELFIGQAD